MVEGSKMFKLNKEDGKKIAKSFGIAVGGFLVAFGAELIPNVDFGAYTLLVGALSTALFNVVRIWLANNQK